jgi:hypothetical protein
VLQHDRKRVILERHQPHHATHTASVAKLAKHIALQAKSEAGPRGRDELLGDA